MSILTMSIISAAVLLLAIAGTLTWRARARKLRKAEEARLAQEARRALEEAMRRSVSQPRSSYYSSAPETRTSGARLSS